MQSLALCAGTEILDRIWPAGKCPVRPMTLHLRSVLRAVGVDLIRYRSDSIVVPRFLCPNGAKLFDFREAPGFADAADEIINQGRTTLDYIRLFVLWQAVRNTYLVKGDVAEVGSYKGGSARFLAVAAAQLGWSPSLHVMDTFTGHPAAADYSRESAHVPGLFGDTDVKQVIAYLADLPNVKVQQGRFANTCHLIEDRRFALVHIDVDIYSSAAECLRFFWPRLLPGGTMVVDDYGFMTCQGLKAAVDEFLAGDANAVGWYMHTGQMIILRSTG